jgi:putative flippase GtrA
MAISVGLFVLVGWSLDDTTLMSILPSLTSMKLNAALALMLSGTALRFRLEDVRWSRAYALAALCAALAAAIGFMTIAEYVLDRNVGMDEWLFQDPSGHGGTRILGRMGVNTALCFLCLGLALLLVENDLFGPYAAQALAVAATGGAFAALIGYAYRSESLYGLASSTPMALHSSIALIVMGIGIL